MEIHTIKTKAIKESHKAVSTSRYLLVYWVGFHQMKIRHSFPAGLLMASHLGTNTDFREATH